MHLSTSSSEIMPPKVKNFIQGAVAIFFTAALAVFCIGTVSTEKEDISLQEKRQLAKFPKFIPTIAKLPEWTKAADAYVQDHFLFRDKLIAGNAFLRLWLFNTNKSQNWIVLPGKDGWLFYLGDWAMHNYLRIPSAEDKETVRAWERTLVFRQQLMAGKGAEYLVAIAPNKEDLHPEYFPERFSNRRGTTMLELMRRHMNSSLAASYFLDLTEPLQQAKQAGQIYFKTDSHWNDRGAYAAYRAIMERIQHRHPAAAALPEERFLRRIEPNSFGGDLVLAMGLTGLLTETQETWETAQPCSSPKNIILTPAEQPEGRTLEKNGCPTGQPLRLLVISDSFIDGMRQFLNETFQQVVYSREMEFPLLRNFIDEYQPDIVLDLRVARNLPKVMSPGQDEAH